MAMHARAVPVAALVLDVVLAVPELADPEVPVWVDVEDTVDEMTVEDCDTWGTPHTEGRAR